MTTNLVHTLFRLQSIGRLPLENFKKVLTPEAYQKCEDKKDKDTWYSLSRHAFLNFMYSVSSLHISLPSFLVFLAFAVGFQLSSHQGYFVSKQITVMTFASKQCLRIRHAHGWQQELSEAGDRAKNSYYASHPEEERTAIGVASVIRQEIELQRKKIRSGFIKQIKIADTKLGEEFLNQVRIHWNKTQYPEMTQEKLYRLCVATVDATQKVQWLKCWNGSSYLRASSGIPSAPFSDATFDTWLHKATFWSQVFPHLLSTLQFLCCHPWPFSHVRLDCAVGEKGS